MILSSIPSQARDAMIIRLKPKTLADAFTIGELLSSATAAGVDASLFLWLTSIYIYNAILLDTAKPHNIFDEIMQICLSTDLTDRARYYTRRNGPKEAVRSLSSSFIIALIGT